MYITAASQRSSRVFTYSLPFFLPTPTAPGAVTMQSACSLQSYEQGAAVMASPRLRPLSPPSIADEGSVPLPSQINIFTSVEDTKSMDDIWPSSSGKLYRIETHRGQRDMGT